MSIDSQKILLITPSSAGGPFSSGELVAGPEPDWSIARDATTVEFQLADPPRSRTTWIVEHEGKIYIPCGYMTSTFGKLWKKWPIEAEKDGRAILRVDGKLYKRQLLRVKDETVLAPVLELLGDKYGFPPPPVQDVKDGALWIFEMAPMTAPS